MEAAAIPAELRATAPGLALRLGAILVFLAAVVARVFLRNPRHAALIVPLWNRLNRAARRAGRIMARLAAGAVPRPRAASPATRSGPRPAAMPSGHAWLVVAAGHEAAAGASRLDHLLSEPDFAALVAASPQLARLLRPLCRMLGLRHEAVPPLPRHSRQSRLATASSAPAKPRPGPAQAVPYPPPLHETVPCPHVFWPWFPRRGATPA